VNTNDLVEVSLIHVGREITYEVAFTGRAVKFHVSRFKGQWRKLHVQFQGDRKR
jgi:hypothetical protein